VIHQLKAQLSELEILATLQNKAKKLIESGNSNKSATASWKSRVRYYNLYN